jgi:hypothetical protein
MPLQKACNRIGGVYYVNNGIGSCYTVIYIKTKYTTARKSCTQFSGYNAHLAYWRDGAALQLVNKNLIVRTIEIRTCVGLISVMFTGRPGPGRDFRRKKAWPGQFFQTRTQPWPGTFPPGRPGPSPADRKRRQSSRALQFSTLVHI